MNERVMKMSRRLISLFFLSLLLLGFAGCNLPGWGDPTIPGANRNADVESKIIKFKTNFRAAVMNFDDEAMLADFEKPVVETTAILTIGEGDIRPYEKDYQTLCDELREVVAAQAKWHLEHNYQLTLNLAELTYQIDSETHGIGEQRFEVRESGDGYPEAITTDTGQIIWEVEKRVGEWKIIKMTILYDAVLRTNNMKYQTKQRCGAFGFGKCTWD